MSMSRKLSVPAAFLVRHKWPAGLCAAAMLMLVAMFAIGKLLRADAPPLATVVPANTDTSQAWRLPRDPSKPIPPSQQAWRAGPR